MGTTSEACDALRDAVSAATRPASSAVNAVIMAQRALPAAGDDIIATMRAAIDMILAAEAAETAFAEATKAARAALLKSMEETGAPVIQTATHAATLRVGAKRVLITGEVPTSMLKEADPPKPRPDLDAIKTALKAGPLLYAVMSNGGEPTLAITSRRQS
jgi:DNA-binding phage protein